MSRAPRAYLVCYDVCDDGRLRRVYKIMRGYGDHLQYSVFRCHLSDLQLAELREKLEVAIRADEDQVLFVPLGPVNGQSETGMFTMGVPLVHAERIVRFV